MDWHRQLIEDDTDPSTPLFWETVHLLATKGVDITPPGLELPPAPLGVQILELKRSARGTPSGPSQSRTDCLRHAETALYQVSYRPFVV